MSGDEVIALAQRLGVRIYENRNVPADEWVILGRSDEPEMPIPADWATLTKEERRIAQAKWAIAHGAAIFVHDRKQVLPDG